MLTSLQVRNFAIVDSIDIDIATGMSVLTGETGAGKSILVDALGQVLGERGSGNLVRDGAKRAEIAANFDVSNMPLVGQWLQDRSLDEDDECNLRRVINSDGRSRAYINGNSTTLQSLKQIGEMLVDIHGQHFHQSLAKRPVQRSLLDHFGGLKDFADETSDAFFQWQTIADELQALGAADSERASKIELLTFQLAELNALDLQPDEYQALLVERTRLQMSGQLADGITRSVAVLFENEPGNAQSLVAEATSTIGDLTDADPKLESIHESLQDAGIRVSEVASDLRRYLDTLEMDPQRQDAVEQRVDAVTDIARKHRVQPEDVQQLHGRLQRQLGDLEQAETRGSDLKAELDSAAGAYLKAAKKLTAGRKKAAQKLADEVSAAMADLGMPNGVFQVEVSSRDGDDWSAHGLDNVEFLISANPGQKPQPLSKVASGGELSRMSLAIQVIASDGSEIPTMVFDEVDSGVGGGVAEMVGRRLRELGDYRQVLCVTHLPQVASLGNNHFRVTKLTDGKSTRTRIAELGGDERVDEIARMLGGVQITKRTRDHAAEMLQQGKHSKRA